MRAQEAPESSYQESKYYWLLLLVAIFINLFLLLCLFLISINNDFLNFPSQDSANAPIVFEEIPLPESKPEPLDNDVAALKPGASYFGIPDEYQEEELIAKLSSENNTHSEETKEIKQETKSDKQDEVNIQEQTTLHLEKQQDIVPFVQQKKEIEQPPAKKNIPPMKTEQRDEKKPEKNTQPDSLKQKITAPIKKELTFSDLAQGFLSSLDEGGNDLMERKGNENIRPDFEEMRYLSYLHKIIWHMQQEWHRDNTIANCGLPVMVVTGVSVTIDKDGVLKGASIVQSCGNHQLDEAILRGIRNASPYPPLPNFLKKDILTVDFGIKHVCSQRPNNLLFR